MFDTLLAKVFTLFAEFMVKIQPIWDKFKVLISIGVGVIIGLIIGWGILPVKWVDAPPSLLRTDYRSVYLAKVAEDFAVTGDVEMTQRKLGLDEAYGGGPWKDDLEALTPDIKTAIVQAERFGIADKVPALRHMEQNLPVITGAPATMPSGGGLGAFIRFMAAVVAIALVAGALWYALVGRKQRAEEPAGEHAEREVAEGAIGIAEMEPSSVKTYTYVLGDDYFDPSFSIEIGPIFYGECGIGITETIGSGDPKKVAAFETWLFDKSDIRTVTTVLASDFAYNDDEMSEKLQPKRDGDEFMLMEPGTEITLETTALRIKARVTEMEYAQGNLPPDSFFQKVTFELQAWVKKVEQA